MIHELHITLRVETDEPSDYRRYGTGGAVGLTREQLQDKVERAVARDLEGQSIDDPDGVYYVDRQGLPYALIGAIDEVEVES